MSGERWVRVERALRSSPERVYRAFTDPEEVIRWFALRVDGSLAVGTRSTLAFEDEQRGIDVVEAEPSRRIVFRWARGVDESVVTTITITIAPRGMGSRLSVVDGPFVDDDPAAIDAWGQAREGWGEALAMIRAYLDFSVDLRMSAT
jgi:uncharacterized protein YndB with AHSA1/START domain